MTSDWSLQRAEFDIDLQNMTMSRSGMMLLKTFDRDRPQLCPHKDCTEMAKGWTLACAGHRFKKVANLGHRESNLPA